MRRFTQLLCQFRLGEGIPGSQFSGKHQKKRIISRNRIMQTMKQLAVEEQTMKYLQTPYLTTEEEAAYVKVHGKENWMLRQNPPTERLPPVHRKLDEMLNPIREGSRWE